MITLYVEMEQFRWHYFPSVSLYFHFNLLFTQIALHFPPNMTLKQRRNTLWEQAQVVCSVHWVPMHISATSASWWPVMVLARVLITLLNCKKHHVEFEKSHIQILFQWNISVTKCCCSLVGWLKLLNMCMWVSSFCDLSGISVKSLYPGGWRIWF